MLELPTFPKRSVLTPRQLEVAACLVHGLTNKETARALNMSHRTVEDHRHEIQLRLGIKNTVGNCSGLSTNWEANMKQCCFQCNGPFGLTRHRHCCRAFCKQKCVDDYKYGRPKPHEVRPPQTSGNNQTL